MAVQINIEESFLNRKKVFEKVQWLMDRVPSREFRVEYSHEEENHAIKFVAAQVTIWSEDAEKLAVDYWWHMG